MKCASAKISRSSSVTGQHSTLLLYCQPRVTAGAVMNTRLHQYGWLASVTAAWRPSVTPEIIEGENHLAYE